MTFLVIAHVDKEGDGEQQQLTSSAGMSDRGFNFRDDKNRHEKISAIIKQFKLACKYQICLF